MKDEHLFTFNNWNEGSQISFQTQDSFKNIQKVDFFKGIKVLKSPNDFSQLA
jgi:hypothetical protein